MEITADAGWVLLMIVIFSAILVGMKLSEGEGPVL